MGTGSVQDGWKRRRISSSQPYLIAQLDAVLKFFFTYSGHENIISCAGFSGDDRRLCTGSWDKTLKMWDVNAGSYRFAMALFLTICNVNFYESFSVKIIVIVIVIVKTC